MDMRWRVRAVLMPKWLGAARHIHVNGFWRANETQGLDPYGVVARQIWQCERDTGLEPRMRPLSARMART